MDSMRNNLPRFISTIIPSVMCNDKYVKLVEFGAVICCLYFVIHSVHISTMHVAALKAGLSN